jgi:hypothetical protein
MSNWYEHLDDDGYYDCTFEQATALAEQMTQKNGRPYVAVDRGSSVFPRYGVAQVPQPGDQVSYSFNGDSYPDGEVAKVSHKNRRVETSTGNVYWRLKLTATWRRRPWALIRGHVDERNPSF